MLNTFYEPVVTLMFNELKKEDSQSKGLLMGLMDSVNTILEDCDEDGLKEVNKTFLISMLKTIFELNDTP
jgi:hypothetical protein